MKKIRTLFTKVIENHEIVDILPDVTPGCEWVLTGEGVATLKRDGTACMVKDGVLYARYDYYTIRCGKRKKRILPDGAIPCQDCPDEVTGHFPHWVPVGDNPGYKWYRIAYESCGGLEDGTYELTGVHFKNNPEHVPEGDVFFKHGTELLPDVPRDFEGIRRYLEEHNINQYKLLTQTIHLPNPPSIYQITVDELSGILMEDLEGVLFESIIYIDLYYADKDYYKLRFNDEKSGRYGVEIDLVYNDKLYEVKRSSFVSVWHIKHLVSDAVYERTGLTDYNVIYGGETRDVVFGSDDLASIGSSKDSVSVHYINIEDFLLSVK